MPSTIVADPIFNPAVLVCSPCLPVCSDYSKSMIVGTQAPKELGTLRGADGEEGLKDK